MHNDAADAAQRKGHAMDGPRARTLARIAATGVFVIVALALSAHLRAQVSTPAPFIEKDQSMPCCGPQMNPCSGESVNINGKEDLHVQIRNSPGAFKLLNHESGTGTGIQTGAQYQYEDSSDVQFQGDRNPSYSHLMFKKHLIRTGTPGTLPDDFFMNVKFFCNAQGLCSITGVSTDPCQ